MCLDYSKNHNKDDFDYYSKPEFLPTSKRFWMQYIFTEAFHMFKIKKINKIKTMGKASR